MFEKADFKKLVKLKVNADFGEIRGRSVVIKDKNLVQLEYRRGGVISQVNLSTSEAAAALEKESAAVKNAVIVTEGRTYEFRRTKKGGILSNSYKNHSEFAPEANDRSKQTALNSADPVFYRLGLTSADGRIKADKADKFRQISRFTELAYDIIRGEKKLTAVDYGCGKAYLDFALASYLKDKGAEADIICVYRRADVIKTGEKISAELGINNVKFVRAEAEDYPPDGADMVIALHACDTATDYALYAAVKAGVKYVLSVPCCQHEVKANMTGGGLLSEYGVIKERFAALATDAVRAAVMEACGYSVQVVEYIDDEHSLKNVMLRCVKRKNAFFNAQAAEKAKRTLKYLGAEQTLYNLLIRDRQPQPCAVVSRD